MVYRKITVLPARTHRADVMHYRIRDISASVTLKPQAKSEIDVFDVTKKVFVRKSAGSC